MTYHPMNMHELLNIYCNLKEVSESILTGKDTKNVYESLSLLLINVKEQCRVNDHIGIEEYNSIEKSVFKVMMREIHLRLVEEKDPSEQDIELNRRIDQLKSIKQNQIPIEGRESVADLEQIWDIACRCNF